MSRDIFEVIANRRTVKRFIPRPVEMDKLLQVVQAGCLAPSSGNIKNWSFVVVTDVDKIRALYPVCMEQEPLLSAMAAIVVTGDVEYGHQMYGMRGKRLYTVQNCAAAMQNMLLAAYAVGLGGAWIGAFDEDKVSDMFEIPNERHRPQAILLFGYPDRINDPKEEKPFGSYVFFNKFGNKVQRPHLVFYDWATEWRMLGQKVKGHTKHVVEQVQKKREERKKTQVEKPGEHSFHRARKHIDSVLDSLKKDEYRR